MIHSKTASTSLKSTIAASWLPTLDAVKKDYDAVGRFNASMHGPGLFIVVEALPSTAPVPK